MQVLTHFPLLKALGWALFNSLWQMAVLWLLFSLVLAIFHTAAAHIRHSLALLFLSIGALWTGATFLAASFIPDNGSSLWLSFLSAAPSSPGSFWQISRSFMDTTLSYGSTLYLLILSGLLVRYCSHYWQTRKLTRKGLTVLPAEFRVFVSATALQLNIRRPVKAWLSSWIDVPLTLGFLKPVILLPAAMISQLTPEQVEAILIHELGHIQRKDYLLHLLVTLLEGLFFFNPFSRLLIRQLKKEREHCCDDLVLQFKYDPHAYISALLALATWQQPVHKLAVAATGSSDKLLLQRARRILLQQEGDRSRPVTRTLVLLLFTGLITVLAFYRPLPPVHRQASTRVQTRAALGAVPVATLQEIAFNQPIHSAPPPVRQYPHLDVRQHSHFPAEPRTRITRAPASPLADDNDIFVNTTDDEVGDGNTAAVLIASSDDLTDAGGGATYAGSGSTDAGSGSTDVGSGLPETGSRDYSLNMPATELAGPAIAFQQGTPAIPNSSFSFRYTTGDSTRPEEQLLYLQQSAQREVLAAVARLQQETAAQLKALAELQTKATGSVHLRQQIQTRQQKLQREYLKKITDWQKKLETTTHIRLIVYI